MIPAYEPIELVVRNNWFHSLNELNRKECGKSITRWHALFIEGIIDRETMRYWLRMQK